MISWHDLEPDEQKTMRRLSDAFMLTSGADSTVPDGLIQVLSASNFILFKQLLDTIGYSTQSIIDDTCNINDRGFTRRHLVLMVALAGKVLGLAPTGKILTQALGSMDDLHELGDLYWRVRQSELRGNGHATRTEH